MNKRSTFAFACFCANVFMAGIGPGHLCAQSPVATNWQDETQSRLRDVYERGKFRPRQFQAEWLPDSSGYIARERDPESNKPVQVQYGVRTGKRIESQLANESQSAPQRLSPDGTRILEFHERNLFVTDLETDKTKRLTNRPDNEMSGTASLSGVLTANRSCLSNPMKPK